MPLYEVHVDPVDPLLFGDNRSARAGLDHVQRDQDPSPLTIHGAVCRPIVEAAGPGWPEAILGRRARDIVEVSVGEEGVAELLGYTWTDVEGRPLFPRPLHQRCERAGGSVERGRGLTTYRPLDLVTPEPHRGWARSTPLPRLLDAELVEEVEGDLLVRESGLRKVLCGGLPAPSELCDAEAVWAPEPRAGIAVDNRLGTVFEGALFTRPYRRFRPRGQAGDEPGAGAGYLAWLRTRALLPETMGDSTMGYVGGDQRRARLVYTAASPADGGAEVPLAGLRDVVAGVVGEGSQPVSGYLAYLLTPALAGESVPGPDWPAAVAAAFGRPRTISGWNVGRNLPRPARTVIPEGSVFFFATPDPEEVADAIRRRWAQPIADEGAAAGFGRTLIGVW